MARRRDREAGEATGAGDGPAIRRDLRRDRKDAGLCPRDGNPLAPGLSSCRRCADRKARQVRKRYRRLSRQPGACRRCGRATAGVDPHIPRGPDCRLCPKCWFSTASLAHFGKRALGPALAELFVAQGFRCALTGRALAIGRDASLDHKVPKSRGGALALANVRWVAFEANMIKGNLRDDELVAACREILAFRADPARRRIERALGRATRRLEGEAGC